MRLPTQYLLLIGLSLLPATLAVSEPPEKPVDPECTVTSPFSENFFDLRKLRRLPDMLPPQADWHVKGLDYGANFSINICGPVLTEISPEGANDDAVGAFYEKNGTVYSIGSASISPHFRGRKLVLSYENGSPCPDAPNYRKSTLMSLMCDHEQFRKPSVSFVGQMNDCAYFFEVRTAFACATINQAQALGPGAVFGAIMGVFAVVYLVGGIVYQRTVMHARGWRQIPHYHAWAAAFGFFWVRVFVMPLVFFMRLLSMFSGAPKRRGSYMPSSTSQTSSGWKRGDNEWA
ncbi:mannose-6-phosphate receptor binding domain-containing protein [Tricharina praecox]|uniref:mannose-6-phosphate receptor binding domain-containing protein n=1 Tax=Tricharina praecox TaxID=43433 RepID=UPI00221F15B4|nr:mannose-6-phosphate receptor binding domain-containing protein [Tricharina praecox]KAI5853464.1 mannose-6-phosphate receptor binding domain-containing protein [Tricharina praecox]